MNKADYNKNKDSIQSYYLNMDNLKIVDSEIMDLKLFDTEKVTLIRLMNFEQNVMILMVDYHYHQLIQELIDIKLENKDNYAYSGFQHLVFNDEDVDFIEEHNGYSEFIVYEKPSFKLENEDENMNVLTNMGLDFLQGNR